jgi:hypothetical protein
MARSDLLNLLVMLIGIAGIIASRLRKRAGLPPPPINWKVRYVVSGLGCVVLLALSIVTVVVFHHAGAPVPANLVVSYVLGMAFIAICFYLGWRRRHSSKSAQS